MSNITIEFKAYGGQTQGAFVDNLLLINSTSILKKPKGKINKNHRMNFWESFLDLSNLAEICCLHDKVFFLSGFEEEQYEDSIEILNDEFLSELSNERILIPYSFLTIDDIQKRRIFNRWNIVVQDIWNQKDDEIQFNLNDEKIKNLFAGCLAEELLGTPYFPCVLNSWLYFPASALILDMKIYSLLFQAYIQIKKVESKRTQLRNLIGGIREPSIPPITKLILSKISSPKEFIEELLILRKQMLPLRNKMAELSNLASSDIPENKWLKQLKSMQIEINNFIQKYERIDRRVEVSRLDQRDFSSLVAKIGITSPEFSLDTKKILGLGLQHIIQLIKRRKIKPLPSIKKKVENIGKITTHLNRVFGVKLNTKDFYELNRLSSACDQSSHLEQVSESISQGNISHIYIPDSSEFRKGYDSIFHIEWFNFELVLKEFALLLRAKVKENYSELDQLLDFGFIHLSSNIYNRAKPFFSKAIESYPESYEAYHGLALCEQRLGKYIEAESLYLKALSLDPENSNILNDIGQFYYKENKIDLAIKYLEKATKKDKQHKEAWSNLGGCLFLLKDYENASKAFQNAKSIDSNFAEPWFGLGLIDEVKENLECAVKKFQKATQILPKEIKYWKNLGITLYKIGNHEQATDALQKVIEENEDDYEMLTLYASSLYLAIKYEKAINVFEKLIKLKPNEAENYNNCGHAYYELGQHDKAISKFKKGFDCDSSDPTPLITAGRIYIESSQLEEARKHFERLTKIFPTNANIEFWLGISLFNINKIEDACIHFKKSIELGFSNSSKLFNIAVDLDRKQEFQNAIIFYDLALSINPNDPECLANLAADLAEIGELDVALENAQKACLISQNDVINLNTLGGIYAKLGNLKEARKIFEKIIEIADEKNSRIIQNAKHVIEQINSLKKNM